MDENPYSPPVDQTLARNTERSPWWHSRMFFLLATFTSAMFAFYCGLAVNVFSTPYLEPHIEVPMFVGFISMALGFAVLCTFLVGAVSFMAPRIDAWHYPLLLIPFMLEFVISWCFFVAFFGI